MIHFRTIDFIKSLLKHSEAELDSIQTCFNIALAYIDKTLDNCSAFSAHTTWTNHEVEALLRELREALLVHSSPEEEE